MKILGLILTLFLEKLRIQKMFIIYRKELKRVKHFRQTVKYLKIIIFHNKKISKYT